MSFILVAVLLAAGLAILAVALLSLAGHARRLGVTRKAVSGEVQAATGLLAARKAALGVAIRDRRAPKKDHGTVTKA